ncbi:VOC family protein [Phenylobacterium sp.]|uniref:VOC family protein n=1 Tax=Phenylobacterium sp. TaxID=1871053 RepID=UPI002E36E01C|nr:VOC family protein [Phenylobacterium sp.]HEX3366434.1 VOC family protein [Phenylobacterium sp.]
MICPSASAIWPRRGPSTTPSWRRWVTATPTPNDAELAYGPGGEGAQFYLYPVTGDRVAGLGTHIAFAADSRAAVDAAYAAALSAGASSVRPAGLHPDIAAGYYGAIVYDPDGNKLEIVAGTMH